MTSVGRAEAQPLARDTWRLPMESDQPSPDPMLRKISAWFIGPAVLSAVWWTVTSSHFAQPEFRAAFLAYAIVAPALTGLLWWHHRPQSQIGRLLTALGFAAWPLCLQGSEVPLLFSIGVLAEAPYAFVTFLVCLALPVGRLSSAFESGFMTLWGVVLVLGWLPFVSMLPTLQGGGPLSVCAPDCPANAFAVAAPSVDTLTFVGQVGTVATITFATVLLGHQLVRLTLASPSWRRANWPIVASISVFLIAFTAYHLHRGLAPLSPSAASLIDIAYMAAFVALPLGFLAALVRAELFSANAARRLAVSLGFVNNTSQLQESLASALGDSNLTLGTWDATRSRYVQADGSELPMDVSGSSRIWVPVGRGTSKVAAFVADDALATERRLLESAADAAFVAINVGRIAEDTLALRAAVVETTDDERRRIARDMHDSVQQRLVFLRVQVALASEQLEGRPMEQQALNRLARELDYVIDDVRTVARRFLPPFVVRNGLGTALRSITRTWPMTIRVDDRGLERHDPVAELTVYNVCLEALQNALDHGGPGVTAHVRITDAADGIWFSVSDDGTGFDPQATEPGDGLLGMTDRVILAGGTINVEASPAQGVTISGSIPESRGAQLAPVRDTQRSGSAAS